MPVRRELQECKWCGFPAVFCVKLRHGDELPACVWHIRFALAAGFAHDGDHGRVTVYKIGVAQETLE